MNLTIVTYCIYLAMSAAFTVWVAQTLFRNGRVFLIHTFRDNYALADSVNHLLVVGFYLINLGYIFLCLKTNLLINDWQQSMEVLSSKVGVVLLVLGAMHFMNMGVFAAMRSGKAEAPAIEQNLDSGWMLTNRDSGVTPATKCIDACKTADDDWKPPTVRISKDEKEIVEKKA